MNRHSVTRRTFLASLATASTAGALASPLSALAHGSKAMGEMGVRASGTLQDAMRALWADHVAWTRLYIISAAAELPDKDATAERLLRNQDDIGAAIAPYYGDEAGTQLAQLLRGHILGAAELLEAAKSGDQAAIETTSAAWYENAGEVATFLNAANPANWPLEDARANMNMHLDMTLAEATHRLQGDFAADIADYDEIFTHIQGFADYLSGGIISQFPELFA